MKKSILFLFLLLTTAFVGKAQSLKYWYIADAKIACQYGDMVMSCLKVRTSPDSAWKDFPFEIEGFIWEPGVEALIELEETSLGAPDSNGQTALYKFIRVVETKNTVIKNRELLGASKWKIVNLQQGLTMVPLVRKAGAWVQFNLDSGTFEGFGGCNSFGANAEVKDGQINFGLAESTLKSCSNDSIEKLIFDAMVGEAQYYFRNNILFITFTNNTTLHLRAEKRIDSLVKEFSKPSIYRGNTYNKLRNGQYGVTLDDVAESKNKNYIFNEVKLTPNEKKTIKVKLVNSMKENEIQEVHILNKIHKVKGNAYAVIVLKDGTKRNIIIKNVL